MLSVKNKLIRLSVFMLNVIMMNVGVLTLTPRERKKTAKKLRLQPKRFYKIRPSFRFKAFYQFFFCQMLTFQNQYLFNGFLRLFQFLIFKLSLRETTQQNFLLPLHFCLSCSAANNKVPYFCLIACPSLCYTILFYATLCSSALLCSALCYNLSNSIFPYATLH
jgi:hypothetical protein